MSLASLDKDIKGFNEDILVHSMDISSLGTIALDEFINGQDTALLTRLIDIILNELSPLVRLAPIYKDDVTSCATANVLYTTILMHEDDDIADIIKLQTAV